MVRPENRNGFTSTPVNGSDVAGVAGLVAVAAGTGVGDVVTGWLVAAGMLGSVDGVICDASVFGSCEGTGVVWVSHEHCVGGVAGGPAGGVWHEHCVGGPAGGVSHEHGGVVPDGFPGGCFLFQVLSQVLSHFLFHVVFDGEAVGLPVLHEPLGFDDEVWHPHESVPPFDPCGFAVEDDASEAPEAAPSTMKLKATSAIPTPIIVRILFIETAFRSAVSDTRPAQGVTFWPLSV
jgi:hypothetical protein